jgi:hypothetical protein
MTLSRWTVIAGSITGRDHQRARRDGQDGLALVAKPDVTAAVVTDGCSSGRMSEVGARLGSRWLASLIAASFPADDPIAAAQAITAKLVERLGDMAASLDDEALADFLLFGFLAAVATEDQTLVFGVGDGTVWIDGLATILDPGPDNAPPYPAYALRGATITPKVHHAGRAGAIAIATDGLEVPIDELVHDDRFQRNPSLLRKRLIVLQDQGAFGDDATIAILRRRA